jgi:hypothetical protein
MSASQTGSNTASNDTASDWTRQYRTQKRRCAEENGVLRNIVKRAEADGVNTKSMINAVKTTKFDPVQVASDLSDQLRYMALIRVPMTREALFSWEAEVTQKTSAEDDLWTVGDAGYHAGRHGANLDSNPHPGGSPFHVHWTKMWRSGQAAIARELGENVKQGDASRAHPDRSDDQPLPGMTPAAPRKAKGRTASYVPGKARTRRKANGGVPAGAH